MLETQWQVRAITEGISLLQVEVEEALSTEVDNPWPSENSRTPTKPS